MSCPSNLENEPQPSSNGSSDTAPPSDVNQLATSPSTPSQPSVSSKVASHPVSILSRTPSGQATPVSSSPNPGQGILHGVVISRTLDSFPSIKTKFVPQVVHRPGPASPAEPTGVLSLHDLSLANQTALVKQLKGWKADKRRATPYPKAEGVDYEFDGSAQHQDSSEEEDEEREQEQEEEDEAEPDH